MATISKKISKKLLNHLEISNVNDSFIINDHSPISPILNSPPIFQFPLEKNNFLSLNV